MNLFEHQLAALERLHSGCILCGGVGSGKSLTALAWYYLRNGGDPDFLRGGGYMPMSEPPKLLYIVTTARKRDTHEWEQELSKFLLSVDSGRIVIDSWNNIGKYAGVKDACFLFDEQRVVGSGAWVKAFLKITKSNEWLLLSATPGDTWSDYIPVFIANGFFKNRTEFTSNHVIYARFAKYPKIDRYVNEGKLIRYRKEILVEMNFKRPAMAHHEEVIVGYDALGYKRLMKERWNETANRPIQNAGELCFCLRREVNISQDRQLAMLEIAEKQPRLIVFYNFDYELAILQNLGWPKGTTVAEWNGHRHEPIPDSPRWVYLVQYSAGAEGWNCIQTNAIAFYSMNYSYKIMVQAAGRIDRLNTPYAELWYYHLKSRSGIDLAIGRALREKRNFNENAFVKKL